MNEVELLGEPVIACGGASESLEASEEYFDQIACPVEVASDAG